MSNISPPSPQEVQRKLSVHTTRIKANAGHVSGTESDSDSILTPDVSAPMGAFHLGNSTQPPLSSIAERRSGSGEDSDEDEPADSGWRTPDIRTKPRNSVEESVLKSGYLWKKGERRKTWKKRWFVLRPAHIAYYKTSAEYQLLRLLDLSDIHSCTPVNLKRHDNTFGLISPNRTFYFQASNQDDVRGWVAAIEEARQTLLATSTQNSASTPIPIARTKEQQSGFQRGNLTISSSPGQAYTHPATSSDSEDGHIASLPTAQLGQGSAPSPTAVNFLIAPPKQSTAAASSATNPASKVILTGYLMKCGSKRRTWRKRWFVLTGEKLLYSGSHMDTKPHRVFPFTEILDALEYELPNRHHHLTAGLTSTSFPPHAASSTDVEGDPASHTFKIVTTKRNLLLCAPTEEDEIKWLGAIRALIARRSGSGVVPGKTPKAYSVAGGIAGSQTTGTAASVAAASTVVGGEAAGSAAANASNVPSGGGAPPLFTSPQASGGGAAVKIRARRPSASGVSLGVEGEAAREARP